MVQKQLKSNKLNHFRCLIICISSVLEMITALGQVWHPEHFVCVECKVELSTTGFFEREGLPYCDKDYHHLFSPRCAYCRGPIIQVRKLCFCSGTVLMMTASQNPSRMRDIHICSYFL